VVKKSFLDGVYLRKQRETAPMSQKRATIKDIAEATGFSTATVSYVLSGKLLQRINKQTQDTIRKKAEELNYLPNFLARSLKAGQSGFVGVLLDKFTESFVPEIIAGAEEVLNQNDYNMVLCHLNSPEEVQHKVNRLLSHSMDGFIIRSTHFDAINQSHSIIPPNLPCVRVARPPTAEHPAALVSLEKIVMLTVEYLLAKGHHRLAIDSNISESRRDALATHLASIGKPAPLLIPSKEPDEILDAMTASHNQATALLSNDRSAVDILLRAQERKIKIPQQFSLLGNDGLDYGKYTTPALTTIAQPRSEQGACAAQLLMQWIQTKKKPKTMLLMPYLIERKSVAIHQ
jgi:DNA-binding LacI/PurR family transcriptional regulator